MLSLAVHIGKIQSVPEGYWWLWTTKGECRKQCIISQVRLAFLSVAEQSFYIILLYHCCDSLMHPSLSVQPPSSLKLLQSR